MLYHPWGDVAGPKDLRPCYIKHAFSGIPKQRGQIKADPKEGANATSPLHSRGIPNKGDKIKAGPKEGVKCYITHLSLGSSNKGGPALICPLCWGSPRMQG